MERRLLLLRHAKSSWDDPALSDQERPLSPRGERDAPRMGAELTHRGRTPDLVLVSPARRARQTADRFLRAAGVDAEIQVAPQLYGASAAALQRLLAAVPADRQCILVIGHNPGLEEWIEHLTGRAQRMPTAALACIVLDSADHGRLEWCLAPKEL